MNILKGSRKQPKIYTKINAAALSGPSNSAEILQRTQTGRPRDRAQVKLNVSFSSSRININPIKMSVKIVFFLFPLSNEVI